MYRVRGKNGRRRSLTQMVLTGLVLGGAAALTAPTAYAAQDVTADDEQKIIDLSAGNDYGTITAQNEGQAVIVAPSGSTADNITFKVTKTSANHGDGKDGGGYNITIAALKSDQANIFTELAQDAEDVLRSRLHRQPTKEEVDAYEKALAARVGAVLAASTETADFQNAKFHVEAANLNFVSGTVLTKAEAFSAAPLAGEDPHINIGMPEYGNWERETFGARVRLVGNTQFNAPQGYGVQYVRLTKRGVLEAESAQLFARGLGSDGKNPDPQYIRDDVHRTVDFGDGTVVLSDDLYNTTYLAAAAAQLKLADGNNTKLVMKDGAQIVTANAVPAPPVTPSPLPGRQNITLDYHDVAAKDKLLHVLDLHEQANYDTITSKDDGSVAIVAQSGDKADGITFRTQHSAGYMPWHGGEIYIFAMKSADKSILNAPFHFNSRADEENFTKSLNEKLADSTETADFRNAKFEVGQGKLMFMNGTVLTRADAFSADGKSMNDDPVSVEIGESDEDTPAGHHPIGRLRLDGNTQFRPAERGGVNVQYIRLNTYGVLEAASAQIFAEGLGAEGKHTDPNALRSDVHKAALFADGVVVLSDDLYNNTYLTKAGTLVRQADNGKTKVVMKDGARIAGTPAPQPQPNPPAPAPQPTPPASTPQPAPTPQPGRQDVTITYQDNDKANRALHLIDLHEQANYGTITAKDEGNIAVVGQTGDRADGITFRVDQSTPYAPGNDNGGYLYVMPLKSADKSILNVPKFRSEAEENAYFANIAPKLAASTETVDFRNAKFFARIGEITFVNGTALTVASAFSGEGKTYDDATIQIGLPDDIAQNMNVIGRVKLDGNTAFNAAQVNGKNNQYIRLNRRGVLEAASAQLFKAGLGTDGKNIDPDAVRDDVHKAVHFASGTVVLSDDLYNNAYLTKAGTLIRDADKGDTKVVVKDGAKIVNVETSTAISSKDVTEAGVYAPIAAMDAAGTKTPSLTVAPPSTSLSADTGQAKVGTLNAKSLDLAPAQENHPNSVTISGSTVSVGSYHDSSLLTVDGKTPTTAVPMTVEKGGKLSLGITAATNVLAADVTVSAAAGNVQAGTLEAAAGRNIVHSATVESGATLHVDTGASLRTTGTLTLSSGAKMQVGGTFEESKVAASGADIAIGDAKSAGRMLVGKDGSLTGSRIFLDPAWKDGATIADASQFGFASSAVDYTLTVGQNSLAAIGGTSAADSLRRAHSAFDESRLTWGRNGITAGLYLDRATTLAATGGLKVDGSLTESNIAGNYAGTNDTMLAAGSLLMVNAGALGTSAALSPAAGNTTATLTIADGAQLYLTNTAMNVGETKSYTIYDGFHSVTGSYAAGSIRANKLSTIAVDSAHQNIVSVTRRKLAAALPGAHLGNIVDSAPIGDETAMQNAAGIRYLTAALNGRLSDAESVAMLALAANPAAQVGASASAASAAYDFADAANTRYSFLSTGERKEKDGVWVQYMHHKTDASGNVLSNFDDKANGIHLGYDLAAKGILRSGIAFTYTKGSAHASGEANDYKTVGAAYYGAVTKGDANILFDAGYTRTKHELMGVFSASPETKIFSLGVTGEWRKTQKETQIIPHVGLRYMNVSERSYTARYGGASSFHYAPETKSLVALPIGIGLRHSSMQKSGWRQSLAADLSYIAVLGGHEGTMRVTLPNYTGADTADYDLMDRGSFRGRLAFGMEKDNLAWNIGYTYQKGDNRSANRVTAGLTVKF